METEVAKTYKQARYACIVGSVLMTALALIGIAILVVYLVGFRQLYSRIGVYEWGWWESRLASLALMPLSAIPLCSFFAHFSRGREPFGAAQSNRLLISALALLIKFFLDCTRDSTQPFPFTVLDGSSHKFYEIVLEPEKAIDPTIVMLIVFIACLALVVRYGAALKEDSDAFI